MVFGSLQILLFKKTITSEVSLVIRWYILVKGTAIRKKQLDAVGDHGASIKCTAIVGVTALLLTKDISWTW